MLSFFGYPKTSALFDKKWGMTIKIVILIVTALVMPQHANADVVFVGETAFQLGDNAFPNMSQCLDPTGCGNEDILVVDLTQPLFPPVSPATALRGHRLDLITIDLDDADIMRLEFPIPIQNQPGEDFYLGQSFILQDFSDAQGINNVELRFDGSPLWQSAALLDHVHDDTIVPIVTYADPELKQFAYNLWYTKLDLSNYGFADGQTVAQIDVRGTLNSGNSWLDLAIVGNLNATVSLSGDFDSDQDVDGQDFLKWQRGFGDVYDGSDLADWEANYGSVATLTATSIAVPEPASSLLLVLAATTSACLRWRQIA